MIFVWLVITCITLWYFDRHWKIATWIDEHGDIEPYGKVLGFHGLNHTSLEFEKYDVAGKFSKHGFDSKYRFWTGILKNHKRIEVASLHVDGKLQDDCLLPCEIALCLMEAGMALILFFPTYGLIGVAFMVISIILTTIAWVKWHLTINNGES